ncbi:MAG: hypothetical protein L0323_08220 [Planctomycetes bacterium]|nr:hypothetical protein [Planctomycetota bacterium]
MRNLAAILLVGLLGAGCIFMGRPSGTATVHVHGLECGHFYDGSIWIPLPSGHVHGSFCGHVRVGKAWTVSRFRR